MALRSNPLTRAKKQKALALLQHNQATEAQILLEQACRTDPRDADAWFLLGLARQASEKSATADAAYRRAVALRPDFLEAWCNLGSALEQTGRHTEALDCYRHALRLNPDMPELLYNTGNVLHALGQQEEAMESYRSAIQLRPAYVEAHDHLGVLLAACGRHDEAIDHFRLALTVQSKYAPGHYNLAVSLKRLGRFDEAANAFRRALDLNPRDIDAHINLGIELVRQKKTHDAIGHYREALLLRPDDADVYNNLGMAWAALQQFDDAAACYYKAVHLEPNHTDANFNLALLDLSRGNFRRGWERYHWRWRSQSKTPRPFPFTTWDGTALDQKNIFLYAEQGLGDELVFLRFVSRLRQRGAGRITYRPSPKIAALLSHTALLDHIAGPGEVPNGNDFVFAVGDLPGLLGIERVDQIPPSLTLSPHASKCDMLKSLLTAFGPGPYIGVTWRAGVKSHERGLHKDVPLELLAQVLCDVPGSVLALQRLPTEGEVIRLAKRLGKPVYDLTALNDDLEQMLALLSLIDEYVGVSNTNMHLRAAVGKTARVLVPAPPEWRWMAEGKESPWFPGFRVYRQGYDGSWDIALSELNRDLASSLPQKHQG